MHACMIFVDRLSSLGDSNIGCACLGPQNHLHNNSLYNIVDLCTACVSLYLGESMHYNIYIYIYIYILRPAADQSSIYTACICK